MLIDSGASLSVDGKHRLAWWGPNHILHDSHNGTAFRFGEVPNLNSLGRCVLEITLPPEQKNKKVGRVIQLQIHVVNSNATLLISRQSLIHMQASLDSPTSLLTVDGDYKIQLKQTPSGHLMLSGVRHPVNRKTVGGGGRKSVSVRRVFGCGNG